MDIEVYVDDSYVTTFEHVRDDEDALFDWLCGFCEKEGYTLTFIEKEGLKDSAAELASGASIRIGEYSLRPEID
ncbi:MAG: hypothetical protein MJ016_03260 [Victivallaceae bacterium]|nr:hypothetical protein [Victivallaceae bacterium]